MYKYGSTGSIKDILKSKLSDNQIALLRLLYHIVKDPKNIQRHLNSFQEDKDVLRTSEINYVPPIFGVTIADSCNLRCPTCLYLLKNPDKFVPSFISPDKFHHILEKYNREKKAEVIFLTGGEPLLHPEIGKLIDISREYNLDIKISTNGILVKNKISSLEKLDYVNVSIDSYDYKSFEKYRGGTPRQFDMIKDGLRALKEKDIYFSMSYLLSSENLFKVNEMIELAESIRPNFVYFHNINPHGCEQYKSLTLQDKNTKIFLETILKRLDYPFDIIVSAIFDTTSPSFLESKCIQPWYYFCFNSVGDISFCCHLAHDPEIGNVFADYDFNSSEMVKFRKAIMAKKIMKSCLYCQRRFIRQDFCRYDSKKKKWFIHK